ncbi:hypothetical protein HMPREF3144_06615 [Oligella sp. HMSC05A10]|nr:single-stranded DNA-binding protein [Oligella sp. HMSC05A10]OFS84513.1 hypothetical protein HMPREF3144_06615 [Oligella sp. HMSC05A10]
MANLNKILIIGRLGADPEERTTQSGMSVSNFSVATTYKSKQGKETEWFKVTFFDRLAEVCNQYLAKGSLVYIEGRIKTEKYTDRDGIDRYVTKVIGEKLQMLGGRDDNQQSNNWGSQTKGETATNSYAQAKGRATASSVDELESDMPF